MKDDVRSMAETCEKSGEALRVALSQYVELQQVIESIGDPKWSQLSVALSKQIKAAQRLSRRLMTTAAICQQISDDPELMANPFGRPE